MKVSALVITYRRPDDVRRCLTSLLEQTRPPDEIVVVSHEGDAETAAALRTFVSGQEVERRVRPVTVPRVGILPAEQAALARAAGEILCFIDDDAVAPKEWIAKLLAHYEDPAVGGVGGQDVIHDEGRIDTSTADVVGRLTWFGHAVGNHHKFISGGSRQVQLLKGCNMSFRRAAVDGLDDRIRGQWASHFEDELCLQAIGRGYRVVYDPAIQVDHYVRRGRRYRERTDQMEDYRLATHNFTYLLLKHLPWPRKLGFLAFTLLVGDGMSTALLHTAVMLLRGGDRRGIWGKFVTDQRGKLAALRTYWSRQ